MADRENRKIIRAQYIKEVDRGTKNKTYIYKQNNNHNKHIMADKRKLEKRH